MLRVRNGVPKIGNDRFLLPEFASGVLGLRSVSKGVKSRNSPDLIIDSQDASCMDNSKSIAFIRTAVKNRWSVTCSSHRHLDHSFIYPPELKAKAGTCIIPKKWFPVFLLIFSFALSFPLPSQCQPERQVDVQPRGHQQTWTICPVWRASSICLCFS